MAASLRFPFTWAQWQELERQALIYKYMVASVPIPPDLLLPTIRNLSDKTFSHSNLNRGPCFNLRFSNGTDPEPGRCRRTDGKKWRCSRDVAPDQKYCERHMHRGRPRSRKPVELHSDINTNTRHVPHTTPATTTYTTYHHLRATEPYPHQFGLVPKFDMKPSSFGTVVVSSPRCVDWMMKGETVAMASPNQQLQQLMQSTDCSSNNNNNTKALFFEQHYEDTLNLNSFTDQNCLFLNPLEEPISSEEREHNTGTASCNKPSVSSSGKLPLSNLSLSMSRGSSPSENLDSIQMPDESGAVKSPPPSLNWMNPASWVVASPPGGPLGEVLQPRTAMVEIAGSNDTSSQDCSSGSPTFKASVAAAKSEIALQWLNYSKLPSSSF